MTTLLFLILAFVAWRLYAFCISGLSKTDKKHLDKFIIITMTSITLLFWLFDEWQFNYWKKAIPSGLEISKNIDIGAEYGLFGGCAFAVFELSPNTINKIKTYGIKTLNDTRKSELINYSEWASTPDLTPIGENEMPHPWQIGMSCGSPSMDETLFNTILDALEKPDSFFALSSDTGVIVIPKLKIIIISTFS